MPSVECWMVTVTDGEVPPSYAHTCTTPTPPLAVAPPKLVFRSARPKPDAPVSKVAGDSRITPLSEAPRASNSTLKSTASFSFAVTELSMMADGCMVIGWPMARPSSANQALTADRRPIHWSSCQLRVPLSMVARPLTFKDPSSMPVRLFLYRAPKPSPAILSALREYSKSLPWALNKYCSIPQCVLKPGYTEAI